MIIVSSIALVFAALFCWGCFKQLAVQQRGFDRKEKAWEAERRALLDRMMHLSGQTWTPPPPQREEPYQEPEIMFPELEPIEDF